MSMKTFVNGKLLAVFFVITNVIYAVMIIWSLPKLVEYSGGLSVFDMRPTGYTFSEAMKLLNSLGAEGIRFYQNVQLRLDIFYPLSFIFAYAIGCLWVFKKIDRWRIVGVLGAIASGIAGVADYVENIFIYNLLNAYPEVTEGLVFNANIATLLKSIATTVAMSIFLVGLILLGFFLLKIRLGRKGC